MAGLDSVLAEPAGQGLGCDGPCGRAAGKERAGARAAGGGELGADEGGEPGREQDRDDIEPQARVGAVLLDVGGGRAVPGRAGRRAVKPVTSTEWPACIFGLGKTCNVKVKLQSLAGSSVKSAVALQGPDF